MIGELAVLVLTLIHTRQNGFDFAIGAQMVGVLTLLAYVYVAVREDMIPFGKLSEYEKRRTHAEKKLGVQIPRKNEHFSFADRTQKTIWRAAGRLYCAGDLSKAITFLEENETIKEPYVLSEYKKCRNRLETPTATISVMVFPLD